MNSARIWIGHSNTRQWLQVFSHIYVYTGQIMSWRTWKHQKLIKIPGKNKWRKPQISSKLLWTSSNRERVSVFFCLLLSHIYERGHPLLSQTVFKKYFTWQVQIKTTEQDDFSSQFLMEESGKNDPEFLGFPLLPVDKVNITLFSMDCL